MCVSGVRVTARASAGVMCSCLGVRVTARASDVEFVVDVCFGCLEVNDRVSYNNQVVDERER